MNKPVNLGLSIVEISKTLIYQFWYDYFKPYQHKPYQHNAKLCYMDTDSFIIHIKAENVYDDNDNSDKKAKGKKMSNKKNT